VRARIKTNHGAELEFETELIELIAERCLDVDSGARNADAVIADTVLTAISVKVIAAMVNRQFVQRIVLDIVDGQLCANVFDSMERVK
jgi:type VI secretion system protein VasG